MNFVFASPQAEKLLGFAPEHWTSHPSFWLDRVRDSDRDWVAQSYQRAIETGAAHSCEFQAITASGGTRVAAGICPCASRFGGRREGQPRYLIGVAVDVTERRMLEDQLVQSERVEAVSRLASRMAHDLNNMLMILTGYSEELLTGLPAGSTLRADVQEILAATDRMSGLTSQLLSFARRQGGATTEMDLESTLGRFGPRLSALLGTHVGLELRMSGEPNRVRADVAQLEQVMTAIVERARQAMHAGEKIVVETSRLDVTEDLRRPNAPLQPGKLCGDFDRRSRTAAGCRSQSRDVRMLVAWQRAVGRRGGHIVSRLRHRAAMGRRYLGFECTAIRDGVPCIPSAPGVARGRSPG